MEHSTHGLEMSWGELGLIAGSRAIIGAGLGMLLAERLTPEQRQATGWTLFMVGVIVSIPLAMKVLGERRPKTLEPAPELQTRTAA